MKKLLFFLPAIILALFSCNNKKSAPATNNNTSSNAPLSIEGMVIKPQAIEDELKISGSLLPFEETELHPEIAGRVVHLYIAEGRYVPHGALLVKLFDGDLQAQLKKLQVQLQIAKKTFERQNELLKIQGISQQEVDLTGLQVSNIQADINIIKTSIAKTEIRAPYSGRLGLKNISPGAYITPQTNIASISQTSQLKLAFSVPEKYSAQLAPGQIVRFTVEGSSKNYLATLTATQSSIEESSRSLKVRAVVKDADKYLTPGAFAKVAMILDKNNAAIMIPTDAVIPQARNKIVVVYKNGKAKFQQVTTGIRDSGSIQVVGGLNMGDTIITTGLLFIRPESAVTLSKVK
jgi:membrane fusion protein, multidrug efflux system